MMGLRGSFIGFTYNGIHSSVFGITRRSSGKFYEEGLTPQLKEKKAEIPNGDGSFYFYSDYLKREFTINFAFYNITEETKRLIGELWNDGEVHELIFDETPYKVYLAKITGNGIMKELSFDFEEKRVYCGEGSFVFTCYYPYAKSRYQFIQDYNANNIHDWAKQSELEILQQDLLEKRGSIPRLGKFKYDEFSDESRTLNGALMLQQEDYEGWLYDNRLLKSNSSNIEPDETLTAKAIFGYEDSEYNNALEWLESSDMPDNLIYEKFDQDEQFWLYNAGDLPMPLQIWYKAPQAKNQQLTFGILSSQGYIMIQSIAYSKLLSNKDYYIVVDTEKGTIEGYNSQKKQTSSLYNQYLLNDSNFFNLPVGKSWLAFSGAKPHAIKYNYIYY